MHGNTNAVHRAACVVLLLFFLVGCGSDGLNRRPLIGAILGGEGRKGALTLRPNGKTAGPSVTTAIVGGSFEFSVQDGPIPGTYQALIRLQIEDKKDGKATATPASGGKELPAGATESSSVVAPRYEPDRLVDVTIPEEGLVDLDL